MKRSIALAAMTAAVALVAGSLQAAAAPKPSIEDPLGDANFINDQGTGDGTFGECMTSFFPGGAFSTECQITMSNCAPTRLTAAAASVVLPTPPMPNTATSRQRS